MKKKIFTLMLLSVATSVMAQGPAFGRHALERRKMMRGEAQKENPLAARKKRSGIKLDEMTGQKKDVRFRYVFAYDRFGDRSSESIYVRHREGDSWGQEELYNVGRYTYEYDTQNRVKTKTVNYEKDDTPEFTSYRVEVDYADGLTAYKKLERSYDGSYCLVESWSCYDNGLTAMHTCYGYDGRLESGATFDRNGYIAGYQNRNYSKHLLYGTLNDSTRVDYELYYNDANDVKDRAVSKTHYKYDTATGRLLEYVYYTTDEKEYGYKDDMKQVFAYDGLGRISSIKRYGNAKDDEAEWGVEVTPRPTRAAGDNVVEPEWALESEETYTYAGDEVYGVGNAWHDVLGFDGPVATMHLMEEDDEVTDFTFRRDASGKLLSVDCANATHTYQFEVNANGEIVKVVVEGS